MQVRYLKKLKSIILNKHTMLFLMFFFYQISSVYSVSFITPAHCPEDSLCTASTGEKRKQFVDAVASFNKNELSAVALSKILKQTGIPITILYIGPRFDEKMIPAFYGWDLSCKSQKITLEKSNSIKILQGDLMVESLKNVDTQLWQTGMIFYEDSQNSARIYESPAPIKESPSAINQDGMYFTREIDGHFYGLHVNKNLQLNILKPLTSIPAPRPLPCPLSIKKSFEYYKSFHPLVHDLACKEVWHLKLKKYTPIGIAGVCE